ncbi:hypothetical protein F0562_010375 [Nyssa sinensis]|uniref:Uncharacterized protein n=1 Tax=Nyssa sinensis TaxID=561372 RepID=A0A5J5A2E3_9ASTE|nr:hypothetical protein F0562_010375 [Nyssa sinensis]
MVSVESVAEGGVGFCGSDLHELSTSPGSFLSCRCRWRSCGVASHHRCYFDRTAVDGFDKDAVGGAASSAPSSGNIVMSCSSSNRSKPMFPAATAPKQETLLDFVTLSCHCASFQTFKETLLNSRPAALALCIPGLLLTGVLKDVGKIHNGS